jgi:uncharacterized protein (TIGR02996 family)
VSKSLDAALLALNGRELDVAIDQLVQAWRARPTAELAAAITALGARIDGEQPPLGGRTPKEREAIWQAKANENKAAGLGLLLATVADTKGSEQTRERLHVLFVNGPDPRVTDRIGQMLLVPPYNGSVSRTTPFWKLLFEWLPKLGDPRVLALVARLPEAWKAKELSQHEREALNKRLEKARPAISAAYKPVPQLEAGDVATLTKISAAIADSQQRAVAAAAPAKRSREELLRAVYENPADDAPRLVFADFLQEQGDLRGEFIALQFKKRDAKLSRAESMREKELFAEHGRSWLGAIEKAVLKRGTVFERGFVAVCEAGRIDGSWEWSTVRELTAASIAPGELHLTSLRSLRGEPALLAHLPQVERLSARGPYGESNIHGTTFEARSRAVWAVPRPSIRVLELEGDSIWCNPALELSHFKWLRTGFPGLRELALPFPLARLDEWRRYGDERGLERLELRVHPSARNAFVLTFTRGDDGKLSKLRVEGKDQELKFYGSVNHPKVDVATLKQALASLPSGVAVDAA